MSSVGLRIKTMRLSRGMSRKDLADRIGSAVSTIGMWENDSRRPSKDMLDALADEFNVPISAILEDERKHQEDYEVWELRESFRRNPEMRILFDAAKDATSKQLKQAVAILEALKASDGNA